MSGLIRVMPCGRVITPRARELGRRAQERWRAKHSHPCACCGARCGPTSKVCRECWKRKLQPDSSYATMAAAYAADQCRQDRIAWYAMFAQRRLPIPYIAKGVK